MKLSDYLDILKYRKIRTLEYKRSISIGVYAAIYFSVEYFARTNDISFAIWDTALTTTIILLTIIFGSFFCGWACFMQRFQDIITLFGRIIFRSKHNNFITQDIRNKLKWFKYIIAFLTFIIPMLLKDYGLFIRFWGWAFMLGMFLCLLERRAYCKYFCCLGAIFKLAGLMKKKSMIIVKEKCTSCNLCSVICPQDCNPASQSGNLEKDLWCTSCNRCKEICPVNAICKS